MSRGVGHSSAASTPRPIYRGMMLRDPSHGPFAERARRSIGEISVAVLLTLAAVVFVLAAIKGNEPETASNEQPTSVGSSKPNL